MGKVTLRLVPNFDISPANLDIDTYQIRRTKRTQKDLDRLKELIVAQGQVEPIQVLKRGEQYFLMAGAGRVTVLRSLGKTASALVYEGLEKEDIYKIAIGTNDGRTEMSAWDRVVSVGEYVSQNGMNGYSVDSFKDVVKIFGRNVSSLIRDYELWEFYSKIPEFVSYFEKVNVPYYVMTIVDEVLNPYKDNITDYEKIVEIVKSNATKPGMTMKLFMNLFVKDFTQIAVDLKNKIMEVNRGDGLTAEEIYDIENNIHNVIAERIEKKVVAKKKPEIIKDDITLKCERVMTALMNHCTGAIENMNKLLKLPYRERIPSSMMLKLSRLITKLNQTGVKLL